MKNYREALKNLLRDDCGQDLIEYALVAGLVALGATVALGSIGTTISTALTSIGTQISTAT